jgi:hypothetical protein
MKLENRFNHLWIVVWVDIKSSGEVHKALLAALQQMLLHKNVSYFNLFPIKRHFPYIHKLWNISSKIYFVQ